MVATGWEMWKKLKFWYMAKKLYDSDYVLNLEYKVKLLQEIADSQKKNIKLLEERKDFWMQKYMQVIGIHTPNDKKTAKIIHM